MKRILYLIIPVAIMAFSGCAKKTDTPPTSTTTPPVVVPLASSTPSNKNVVLEDFTGVRCGYCPNGHILAKAFVDAYPGKVFVIATHAGQYATAMNGWPDYTTEFGESIRAQTNLAGYPAGTINRHRFTSPVPQNPGGMALNRGDWQTAGSQIMEETAPVNLGLKTTWDAASRTLTVTSETYYTADETAVNHLNIAMVEDGIVGLQEDYSKTPNLVYESNDSENKLKVYLEGGSAPAEFLDSLSRRQLQSLLGHFLKL
jgi:hypothetical protein